MNLYDIKDYKIITIDDENLVYFQNDTFGFYTFSIKDLKEKLKDINKLKYKLEVEETEYELYLNGYKYIIHNIKNIFSEKVHPELFI
jgi:hypothetical protein